MSIQTILVPVDFSPHAQHALEYALDLAKQLGANLYIVHAFHMPATAAAAYDFATGVATAPPEFWKDMEQSAAKQLKGAVADLDAGDVEVTSKLVVDHPTNAITDLASEIGADLIVMGTRGLTGLKHIVLGSVAERTIRLAPCPVLTLKAHDD